MNTNEFNIKLDIFPFHEHERIGKVSTEMTASKYLTPLSYIFFSIFIPFIFLFSLTFSVNAHQ